MSGDAARPGLFGFLATRFSSHPENIATEALAYVLRTSIAVSRAFEDYVRRTVTLPSSLHVATQSTGEDGATPDLVGMAVDGSTPLLVEAKFWAGLTNHQPVSYLKRLPAGQPGVLLFIVPSIRLDLLWTEVIARTAASGTAVSGETNGAEYRHAFVNEQHGLAMTSWRALLAALVDAAVVADDRSARSDLEQLRGLCDRMDTEGFLPLDIEDLSGSVAVRLLQYSDLINRSIDRMVADGIAATKTSQGSGLYASAAAGWWGRYFALADVVCLLRFAAAPWARDRATPIWLQIGYRGQPTVPAILDALAPLRAERSRVFTRTDSVDVAIDLQTNADVDSVIDHMIEQIQAISVCLAKLTGAPKTDGDSGG